MIAVILIVHRYLGVTIGALMLLWCLSGFVMMYQGYPQLTEADRRLGLAPLQLAEVPPGAPASLPDDMLLRAFRVEMLGGRPVLRARDERGQLALFDLRTGLEQSEIDTATALIAARNYGAGHGIAAIPAELGLIDADQWTVEGADRLGPLHHLRFDDAAGTELYVAARGGEAVQLTTRHSRVWSYFGAVPHWLYPMVLRRNGLLWSQVVVWTSLTGVFLTFTGAFVGIAHFRRHAGGRWSPFRGWNYWHHIAGLVFGLLALTWVASGLFTMNPWGFLDTSVGMAERTQLSGTFTGADVKRFLAAAPALAKDRVVQFEAAPLGGSLFVLSTAGDGTTARVTVDGETRPLKVEELAGAIDAAAIGPVARITLQDYEDTYYYSGYQHSATLPVYRVALSDDAHSTLYLDATSGLLVDAVDKVARQSRWLRTGLHDFDFTASLRRRPLWDAVVLLLLAGVTAVCMTGTWLAFRRVGRDARRIAAWAARSWR